MSEETPQPKARLRKLRRGVTMQFNGYDSEGIPQWLLYNAGRNNFFIIGAPEYEMLSRWDLVEPQAIIDAVNKETIYHVEMKDFEKLQDFLNRHYLVELRWRNVYQKAKEQKLIKGQNIFYWFIRYYLFFRVPLFHPDKILDKTKAFGSFLFNRYTFYVMTGLGILAVYQIGTKWQDFTHTFATLFSWQGLFSYMIAFTFIKFFHELGHAYMCKQYGVPVPTMGIAFLVFWPVLYTDTTLSWSLPSHQRIRIALAGMWVETYMTIIAALIWSNVHNLTIQMICYVTVAINWVSTLLINVSPFMRFDGYYVLSDSLKTPNLQSRSFELARWQIRNWLFGWEEPVAEQFSKRMHWILVIYAIATWIYRLIIYFGIALLVYHYFFKVIGILLFGIEIFAFILRPVVGEFQVWYEYRKQFTWNHRTIITVLSTIAILFLLLFPINNSVKLNATLSYAHQFLYANQEAILESKLPSQGTLVKVDQPIIELKSPSLEHDLEKANLEYQGILAEVRRASLSKDFSDRKNPLLAQLQEKKSEIDKFKTLQENLIIRSPFNGVIGDTASDLYPGVVVMKDEWLVDVMDPSKVVIEAFVEETDLDQVKMDVQGFFYPENLDDPVVPLKVVAIEPANAEFLAWHYSKQFMENNKKEIVVDSPSYLASELGGKIATNLTESGEFTPVDSVYRVLLIPTDEKVPVKLKHVELGTVILGVESRSFIGQIFYKIRKVVLRESGF